MTELQSGDKVKYHTGDNKWKNGVIHGVRKVDDITGVPRVLTYLVDTGNDHHVDIRKTNLKDAAHAKEFNKHVERGLGHEEAHQKARLVSDKLPDDFVTDVIRQPEQVDVRPENIKLR